MGRRTCCNEPTPTLGRLSRGVPLVIGSVSVQAPWRQGDTHTPTRLANQAFRRTRAVLNSNRKVPIHDLSPYGGERIRRSGELRSARRGARRPRKSTGKIQKPITIWLWRLSCHARPV